MIMSYTGQARIIVWTLVALLHVFSISGWKQCKKTPREKSGTGIWRTHLVLTSYLTISPDSNLPPPPLTPPGISSSMRSVRQGRSVSQGAAQKTVREKKVCPQAFSRFLSPRFFYFFAHCFLCCALTNWTPGRGYGEGRTETLRT